ncbi:hypothetical protein [Marinicellulosiphila megalodicopiae]|uniref:hypothetical protein n=1 Tax=Marinicellulosiphila megalodicopiae TaxID=2724896 RepID=UPI003BB0A317
MNIDKSTKRIEKRVKKGFQGYPQITLSYFGETIDCATSVVVGFIEQEGAPTQEQKLVSIADAKKDETIQTTILKIIERADAKTVIEIEGISII